MQRYCEICGNEIPYSDIGKGYEMPDGRMVVLTSEDFAELPLPTAKSIEVLEFVPIDEVDPLFFAKAYYLAADAAGVKPYVLFRDALTKTGQAALVKVAPAVSVAASAEEDEPPAQVVGIANGCHLVSSCRSVMIHHDIS